MTTEDLVGNNLNLKLLSLNLFMLLITMCTDINVQLRVTWLMNQYLKSVYEHFHRNDHFLGM